MEQFVEEFTLITSFESLFSQAYHIQTCHLCHLGHLKTINSQSSQDHLNTFLNLIVFLYPASLHVDSQPTQYILYGIWDFIKNECNFFIKKG